MNKITVFLLAVCICTLPKTPTPNTSDILKTNIQRVIRVYKGGGWPLPNGYYDWDRAEYRFIHE